MLQVSEQDVRARLTFDNPWWRSSSSSLDNWPIRRLFFLPFFDLVARSQIKRAVVLMGPRRVGKTVILHQAIEHLVKDGKDPRSILYVSLDTPIYTGLSLERILTLFFEASGIGSDREIFVFFDEIQYLRDWEIHLKSLVDSYPGFRFVASGSAAAALRLQSRESGAGRFTDFVLPPLTFCEYLNFIGRERDLIDRDEKGSFFAPDITALNSEFLNYLNYGGYPEAVLSDEIRANADRYIKTDIIEKVLLRDLPSLYGVTDIQELNRLFQTLAYNSGSEVSLEGLSMNSGVSKNTLKRYIEYLEAAFLIRRVFRVDFNARRFKREVKFKVYLTNASMRSALFGIPDEADPAIGLLVETAIFAQWLHNRQSEYLHYARWPTGEVDIVMMDPIRQKADWAVEVKWSDRMLRDPTILHQLARFAQKNELKYDPTVTSKTVEDGLEIRGTWVRIVPASLAAYRLGIGIFSREKGI